MHSRNRAFGLSVLALSLTFMLWTAAAPAADPKSGGPASFPTKPAQPKPIKKICIMTDLEGVAGVRDWEQWGGPGRVFYPLAQKLLTAEVNAAIEGFAAGGAEEFTVIDGHGRGAVAIDLLDPRARLERGWPTGWPGAAMAGGGFDAVAWVGQHAKAGTRYAHLAHTQSLRYLDLTVNGVSIGELGQFALCASELGVRAIFVAGDEALAKEAQSLLPGIETVAVKRGTTPSRGDGLTESQYEQRNLSAIHLQPEKARVLIRAGAERAVRRAAAESFGLLALSGPFDRVTRLRPLKAGETVLVSHESHPTSVIAMMNLPSHFVPETGKTAAAAAPEPRSGGPSLHIKPRYYRWFINPGQEWTEKNTGYATLDWNIPISQAAVVVVDAWDRHYIRDPEIRAEKIIQEKIRPLLTACRQAGLQIIHAPSPGFAKSEAAWVGHSAKSQPPAKPAADSGPTWPPYEFRGRTGPYKQYALPPEPMRKAQAERLKDLKIHSDVRPEGSDVVIATGDELHRYCREKGIVFLFYVGFNTNACILLRDYGTLEMGKRGYGIVIVRDCTTGMESFETSDQLLQTRGAILFLEMFGNYSTTSEELLSGLPKRKT